MQIARWGRARRELAPQPWSRVLDVGCAFGYGTAQLPGSLVVGLDRSERYLCQASLTYPYLAWTRGDAAKLPFPDSSFDAVVALDVLEHLPNARAALDEFQRVLRQGGQLILSVPNRGILWQWDSLNRYRQLRQRFPRLLPLDPTEDSPEEHRHFSLNELRALLPEQLQLEAATFSGVGWAEFVHLAILLLCRGVFKVEALYQVLRFVYYAAYLVEDTLTLGPASYHLFAVARKS